MTPIEIHHCLKDVCGEDAIKRSIVHRWEICDCETGKAMIVNETWNRRPITATYGKYRKSVNYLIKHDRRFTRYRKTYR